MFFTTSSTAVWVTSCIIFLKGSSKKSITSLVPSITLHKFFIPFTNSESLTKSSKFIFFFTFFVDISIPKSD